MGYLFCQKCGGYYELKEGESLDDFAHCSCGGSLTYTENINRTKLFKRDTSSENNLENINQLEKTASIPSENMSPSPEREMESEVMFSDFKDEIPKNKIKKSDTSPKKQDSSQQLSYLGLALMLLGLLLLIFAFFYPFLFFGSVMNNPDSIVVLFVQTVWIYLISIILMILGTFIFLFFTITASNNKKRSKVNVMEENLKRLPGNYTLLSNVKIPKTRSIIGNVVIGSNGIFIIRNKKGNGNFFIRDDEWWQEKGNKRIKAILNPGKMVKMNSIDLKQYLESHNVNVEYMWITPIVSFPPDQYIIEKAPKNYSLVSPEDVSRFIVSQKRTMPQELMLRSIALLARVSN